MTFIDTNDPKRQRPFGLNELIGPQEGANKIFLLRGTRRKGGFVGLHWHGGEEAIRVLSGKERFHIGSESKVCHAGEIAFFPAYTQHGFVVLSEEALLEVMGQQRVGSYYLVIAPDGTKQAIEVYTKDILADHEPPEGTAHTTYEELAQLMSSTRHLL